MAETKAHEIGVKVDFINRFLVPILVVLCTWIGSVAVELKTDVSVLASRLANLAENNAQITGIHTRVTAIESNRYTAADARFTEARTNDRVMAVAEKVDRLAAKVPDTIPPEWFLSEVRRIEAVTAALTEQVRLLERASHNHIERTIKDD